MEGITGNPQAVTTAAAAKIVGVGYEGLRSYLKRGLLGSSGSMAAFVGRDTEAPDLSSASPKWRRFGSVDLCLIRLAKLLMDAGLPFTAANSIASDPDVRRLFQNRRAPAGLILTWGPYSDFIVFGKEDLAHLPDRLTDLKQTQAVYTLIRLAPIWEEVQSQMSAILAAAPAGIGAN